MSRPAVEAEVGKKTVFCRRVDFGARQTELLTQQTSISRERVLPATLPHAILAYMHNGNVARVVHENEGGNQIDYIEFVNGPKIRLNRVTGQNGEKEYRYSQDLLQQVRGLVVVPKNPLSEERDLMFIDLGIEAPASMVDLPEDILRLNLRLHVAVMNEMKKNGRPVYMGINNSAGTMEGAGLQSVLWPHSHVFQYDEEMNMWLPDQVRQVRNGEDPDGGISRKLGTQAAEMINGWGNIYAKADGMGLTAIIPGATPDSLLDPRFINDLKRLFHTMHWQEKELFAGLFEENIDNVIGRVQQARREGQIDMVAYNKLFQPRATFSQTMLPLDFEDIGRLHEYHEEGQLRLPPGWTVCIQFNNEGTFLAMSYGLRKRALGPVQSIGLEFERLDHSVPPDEMRQKREVYQYYREVLLAA